MVAAATTPAPWFSAAVAALSATATDGERPRARRESTAHPESGTDHCGFGSFGNPRIISPMMFR